MDIKILRIKESMAALREKYEIPDNFYPVVTAPGVIGWVKVTMPTESEV